LVLQTNWSAAPTVVLIAISTTKAGGQPVVLDKAAASGIASIDSQTILRF
jgi:hypothetical protein